MFVILNGNMYNSMQDGNLSLSNAFQIMGMNLFDLALKF